MAPISNPVRASTTRGFGYVMVPLPQTTHYTRVGRSFTYSHLDANICRNAASLTFCVWLEQAAEGVDPINTLVFFICPGRCILPVAALGGGCQSAVTTLDLTQSSRPTNNVSHELFSVGVKPCLLFIRQGGTPDADIEQEAKDFSFVHFSHGLVKDCLTYLEKCKGAGDAVQSSALAGWYTSASRELESQDPARYLFDPTQLAAGIIKHLAMTLLEFNKFNIDIEEDIMIPMIFVRTWAQMLTRSLEEEGKDGLLRSLLDPTIQIGSS